MLMLLFAFVTSVLAKTDDCSLSQILTADKPHKKCVEAYLAKIPNQEDRTEAKFRLQQWKPIKDLQVDSADGRIEAFIGEKFLMRTILLQRQKPMLIYMDGKILADNSDNPSFARRLDNAMKKNKSAALDFILPQAHAEPSMGETQTTLTLLYALDEPNAWGTAQNVVTLSNKLETFLPASGWLTRQLLGSSKVRCARGNLVETTQFRQRNSYSDIDTRLQITPKSSTEFIVTGLKHGQSHLIKLSSWEARLSGRAQNQMFLNLKSAATNATISTCADVTCETVTKVDPFDQWNYIMRKSPEEDQKLRKKNLKSNTQTLEELNKEYREELVGKLFGMSVMGACCTSQTCREVMSERFNIDLQPNAPTEAHSAH